MIYLVNQILILQIHCVQDSVAVVMATALQELLLLLLQKMTQDVSNLCAIIDLLVTEIIVIF